MALDLKPEASAVQSARRNSQVQNQDRIKLTIQPDAQYDLGQQSDFGAIR